MFLAHTSSFDLLENSYDNKSFAIGEVSSNSPFFPGFIVCFLQIEFTARQFVGGPTQQ